MEQEFSICKVDSLAHVDWSGPFCFAGKTDRELSVVCTSDCAPQNPLARDGGWRAFRIEGTLEFSLVGVLSRISMLLAENQIGIFAISTYDTDDILTRQDVFDRALAVRRDAGYQIERQRT